MIPTDIAAYLLDLVFSFFFLRTAGQRSDIPKARRVLAVLFLMATAPLYPLGIQTIFTANFVTRYVYRFLLCCLFLLTARGTPLHISLYCAAYTTSLCIIVQNIFLTPLTTSIFLGRWEPTDSPVLNVILSLLLVCGVRAVCYTFAYRNVPLSNILQVGAVRIAVLTAVTVTSVYIRILQVPMNSGAAASPELSYYLILLQAALLLCLIFFEQYQSKLRENTAYRLQEVATRATLQNIQVRQEKDEEVRALRHDLRNHMLTLRHLVKDGGAEDAVKYIDDFLGKAGQSEVRLHTGSPLLDALLGEKLAKAAEDGIICNVVMNFQQAGFIEDFDLCVIFGNALDNAIESCLKVDAGSRFIDVKGGPMSGSLVVRIANSASQGVSTAGGLPLTTKADRENHGFGLRNIRRTVEKYRGSLDTHVGDGEFTLSLLIPLPVE